MPLQLRQLLLGLVLFLQPGVDDGVAVGDLMARAWMDDHLLGGLVHGQQLAQIGERLVAGFVARRRQHFFEHVLDQVVLVFEEFDDVIGRLNKCFNHGNYLRFIGGFDSAQWAVRHPLATRGRPEINP